MCADLPDPARRTRRRGSGAVTLHDVAQLANAAPITTSRAPEQFAAFEQQEFVRWKKLIETRKITAD